MKICKKCKILKELKEFNKNNDNKKTGLSAWCRKCSKEYKKEHYQNNKEKYLKNKEKHNKWFFDLKNSLSCSKCGFNHPAALDFHHIDPKQKKFGISLAKVITLDKELVKQEIAKCIVLCANCHRIEHAVRYNEFLKKNILVKV